MPCRAIEYGLFAKVDCRTAIDCHRTRHCGSRGGNWGQASLARSPHPTSVRSLPSGLNCVCRAVSRRGGWPPTAVSGCRESGGMERSGTSSAEYCLALSTITAVKHDLKIAVVSARHNCSREVEDEQQVKLDGAVAAGPDCKSSLPEAEFRLRQGGSLQIQRNSRTDSGGSKAGGNANFANVGILALLCTHKWNYCWTYEQRCD